MRRLVFVVAIAACGGSKPPPPAAPAAPVANAYDPAKPVTEAAPEERPWSWQSDDRAYLLAIVADLRQTGEHDRFPRLVELADHVEALANHADEVGLSKQQVLIEYAAIEDAMTDPVPESVTYQLDDLREIMRRRARWPREWVDDATER